MSGVHVLPHVNMAGSVGTALNNKKVMMLSTVNMKIMTKIRRTIYGNIIYLSG
jgi:hypothetical protein